MSQALALLVSSALLVLALPGPAHAAREGGIAATADSPDILVVMVDDLGYIPDDRLLRRLPNIRKRFLEEGARLTQMHSETPLCCPGRAAFQTGQHTLRHGVVENDGDLLDPRTTINLALQRAGYLTYMVGKYYNSYEGPRVPPGWDRIAFMGGTRPTRFWVDGVLEPFEGPKNEVVRILANDWLEQAPLDRPVFAWLSFTQPHMYKPGKVKGTGSYFEPSVMRRDRGSRRCRRIHHLRPPTYSLESSDRRHPMPSDWPSGWRLKRFCEALLVVDRSVRRLVEIQRRRGRPGYMIFLSDNGMSWGQRGFSQKRAPTASRLPFYVSGPGVERGSKVSSPTSNIDIAATIAEMAGVAFPSADGQSFLGALRARGPGASRRVLMIVPSGYLRWSGLHGQRWRYIRWDDGSEELYDLREDPWGSRNVADERPALAAELRARLARLIAASRS